MPNWSVKAAAVCQELNGEF